MEIMDVSKWQGKEGLPSKPYLDPTFTRNYAAFTRLDNPVNAGTAGDFICSK